MQVRPQTLYANVSRGKIRAKSDAKDSRRSLYHQGDVMQLAKRQTGRRKTQAVAADTIDWGEPVLSSGISTVVDGRLWYRGLDAVELAATSSLEQAAQHLWEGGDIGSAVAPTRPHRAQLAVESDPLGAALIALARRSANDLPSYGRTPAALREEAGTVLQTLIGAVLGQADTHVARSISWRVANAWQRPEAEDLIRQALVLLADHELNASTFATRVAASTGASLSAAVLAGLATLTGPLHGRASIAVQALIDACLNGGTEATVTSWLRQGRPFPGFGHPLYPDGDVRATALLSQLSAPPIYTELAALVERWVGERPNIDFALTALAAVHTLSPEAPLVLFALGRCVGWLAHALEQVETGQLIRPRARYIGVAPGGVDGGLVSEGKIRR